MTIRYDNHIYFGEINIRDMFEDENTAKEYDTIYEERKRLAIKIRELNNIIKKLSDDAKEVERKDVHNKTIERLTAWYSDVDDRVKQLERKVRHKIVGYVDQYLDYIIKHDYRYSHEVLRHQFDFKAQYITKKIETGIDKRTGEVLDLYGLFITFPVKSMLRKIIRYPSVILGELYFENPIYKKAKKVKDMINLSKTIFYTKADLERFLLRRFRRVTNLDAPSELLEVYEKLDSKDLAYLIDRGCYSTTTLRDVMWQLEYDGQMFYRLKDYLDANRVSNEVIRKYVVVPPSWDGKVLQKRLARYVLFPSAVQSLDLKEQ